MDPVSRAVRRFSKEANKRGIDMSEDDVFSVMVKAQVIVLPVKTAETIMERAGRAPALPA